MTANKNPKPPVKSAPSPRQYLGDGVYVDYDGYHIVMTTENGLGAQNKIFLEPAVVQSFERYVAWLKEQLKK